jgi:hypothetical protein
MHELLTADLGPGFYGWQGTVDGKLVCIATPLVERDPATRRLVHDLFKRHGGGCAGCLNCPIGRIG